MTTILAQAAGKDPTPLFVWVGILIVAVVVLFSVLMIVKRKLFARDSSTTADRGLLDDLRAMRDRGEITPEEYDATRKTMAARLAGRAAKPKPAAGGADPHRNTHG